MELLFNFHCERILYEIADMRAKISRFCTSQKNSDKSRNRDNRNIPGFFVFLKSYIIVF